MAFAEGYIDVASRIVDFRTKHPEGSLQPADPTTPYRIESIGDQTYIVVVAAAYRAPDDPRPGIGQAYEVFPGKTPYTRGSELQNAETSAWGRAIVAALAGDTHKGIASQEEVRNRQAERDPAQQTPEELVRQELLKLCDEKGIDPHKVGPDFKARMGKDSKAASEAELRDYLAMLQSGLGVEPLLRESA